MLTTIAILGVASPMGQVLTRRLVSGPCSLRLFDNDEDKADRMVRQLQQLVPRADVEVLPCSATASWEADLVILAMPLAGQAAAARHIAPFVTQKLVWSVTSPTLGEPATAATVLAELQVLLPHSIILPLPNLPARPADDALLPAEAARLVAQLLAKESSLH